MDMKTLSPPGNGDILTPRSILERSSEDLGGNPSDTDENSTDILCSKQEIYNYGLCFKLSARFETMHVNLLQNIALI